MYVMSILITMVQKYGASENRTMTRALNSVGNGVVIKVVNGEDIEVW